jgi:NADH:ubiquinone oxidoreductase subunit F (NADH-binding)
MEGDPFVLIEGMVIAGIATGATKGYVYLRSEYPHAIRVMNRAVEIAREQGLLGASVLGSDFAFDMEIRVGAGAYVCGEETALLESLEGRRGVVRAKPPLPAHKGFLGRPTVVNNVISLASVPVIMDKGADFYRDFGMGRSRGTIPIQIAGNVKHGGLFEAAFGMTLGELIDDIAGGTATGRPVKAVQVGGPLGAYFPRELFDTPFDYEAFAAKDGLIGHAGIVVFDDTADMLKQARFAFEFCAVESCGKCTPCRIGSTRGVETVDKIRDGIEPESQITLMTDLCNTMKFGSLCALGGFTPYPVMSALTHFPMIFVLPHIPGRGVNTMTLIQEIDYGTPASKAEKTVRLTIDGDNRSARRHIGDARLDGSRHSGAETLRHRHGRRLRLLPALPGRDRGPQRHARLLHDACGRGHGGPHPDRAPEGHPPRRDGTLHLRSPARLPDLRGQWRLRAAGHGRRRRPARRALRL